MKRAFALFAVLLAFVLLPRFSFSQESGQAFEKMWNKFSDLSSDILELATKDDRNAKSAFELVTFQEPKYVRLLKKAQDVLKISSANDKLERIGRLKERNRELKEEITDLKRKRIGAKESSLNPLATTKASIDKKVAADTAEIEENETEASAIRDGLLAELNQQGVQLSAEELDYFLVAAEGEELMKLMNIAENMKRIQRVIERQLGQDKNNTELARMYAGMYLVSLEAYGSAHETAMENIEAYRSQLAGIAREAQDNHEEAKALRKKASPEEYQSIDANIGINARTIEVAEMYDDVLRRRTANLAASRKALQHRIDVARNTYKTITNGLSLISIVNRGENDYAILINFEMPELRDLHSGPMLSTFAEISDRLKSGK